MNFSHFINVNSFGEFAFNFISKKNVPAKSSFFSYMLQLCRRDGDVKDNWWIARKVVDVAGGSIDEQDLSIRPHPITCRQGVKTEPRFGFLRQGVLVKI